MAFSLVYRLHAIHGRADQYLPDGNDTALDRFQLMKDDTDLIASGDWTKHWNANISVKITAIALWPTIIIVFLAAYFFLDNLEQKVTKEQQLTATNIAHQASNLWPADDQLQFHEKLELLRQLYRATDLPGFELSGNGKIYSIGNLNIQPAYYDLELRILDDSSKRMEVRVFFPEAHATAESIRKKIIGAILLSLMLFGLFLSLATHIILDKPLKVLVDATRKISEGQLQVRVDTSRDDEFGTLAKFFNAMVDNLVEQKDLEHAAKTDFLTGIANRRHFDDTISRELRRNARTRSPLTIIMCDVDYFKQYNDLYNHVAGDLCLKHIARTLESVFNRAGDLVARYGGEEFVIILPNTGLEQGITMANTLREQIIKLKIPHNKSDVSPYVTISVGVATITNISSEHTAAQLIESADKVLYQAKQNGRNRVESIAIKLLNEVPRDIDSSNVKKV